MTDEMKEDVEHLARIDGALAVVRAHKLAEAERKLLKADTYGAEASAIAVVAVLCETCGPSESHEYVLLIAIVALFAIFVARVCRWKLLGR